MVRFGLFTLGRLKELNAEKAGPIWDSPCGCPRMPPDAPGFPGIPPDCPQAVPRFPSVSSVSSGWISSCWQCTCGPYLRARSKERTLNPRPIDDCNVFSFGCHKELFVKGACKLGRQFVIYGTLHAPADHHRNAMAIQFAKA